MAEKKSTRKVSKAPARTLEGREDDLIRAAYDEAERQIKSGKASASLILHFVKQGSRRERLEQESIMGKIELDKAKVDHIQTDKKILEMYEDAITAMSVYRGEGNA